MIITRSGAMRSGQTISKQESDGRWMREETFSRKIYLIFQFFFYDALKIDSKHQSQVSGQLCNKNLALTTTPHLSDYQLVKGEMLQPSWTWIVEIPSKPIKSIFI